MFSLILLVRKSLVIACIAELFIIKCGEKGMDEVNGEKNQQMPPASVMTKLIFIMVWRKLIRNPNTYSSVLGIAWSLISPRYSKNLYSSYI